MKKLNMFTYFDFEGFAEGKRFMSIGQREWKDFNSGETLGAKIEVVIAQDKTFYGNQGDEVVNNLYEKLTLKVRKEITVPMNVEIHPVNVEAKVYGEYRNQLSVIAEDIEVISK